MKNSLVLNHNKNSEETNYLLMFSPKKCNKTFQLTPIQRKIKFVSSEISCGWASKKKYWKKKLMLSHKKFLRRRITYWCFWWKKCKKCTILKKSKILLQATKIVDGTFFCSGENGLSTIFVAYKKNNRYVGLESKLEREIFCSAKSYVSRIQKFENEAAPWINTQTTNS